MPTAYYWILTWASDGKNFTLVGSDRSRRPFTTIQAAESYALSLKTPYKIYPLPTSSSDEATRMIKKIRGEEESSDWTKEVSRKYRHRNRNPNYAEVPK